eukprot:10190886-Alexandrium_andersonii.AAC.1
MDSPTVKAAQMARAFGRLQTFLERKHPNMPEHVRKRWKAAGKCRFCAFAQFRAVSGGPDRAMAV